MKKLTKEQVEVGMSFQVSKVDSSLVMDAARAGYDLPLPNVVQVNDILQVSRPLKRNSNGINFIYWKDKNGLEYASYWTTFRNCTQYYDEGGRII